MAFQRFLIEIGQGVDMHGEDCTDAALKAVRDSMHHCCMAGIHDIFGLEANRENIRVRADLYVPRPDSVDIAPIRNYLSMYDCEILLHEGGAAAEGLCLPQMGAGTHITIALAVLTVYINTDNYGGKKE